MRALFTILVALFSTMTISCTSDSGTSTGTQGTWHFANFSEARAFRLNWDDETSFDQILDQEGKLNATRVPEKGIRLTSEQIRRLEAAVTGSHPEHPVADCFYPHHAFVFFNDAGKVVGNINICFLCSNYRGEPKGYAENWDLGELKNLISDLGMPIRNPEWD